MFVLGLQVQAPFRVYFFFTGGKLQNDQKRGPFHQQLSISLVPISQLHLLRGPAKLLSWHPSCFEHYNGALGEVQLDYWDTEPRLCYSYRLLREAPSNEDNSRQLSRSHTKQVKTE